MMASGAPLADPTNSGALSAAVTWLRDIVIGTPATIIATIAVAAVGMLMLQGRLPLRRGSTVIFGCFIIFGAAVMVQGLMQMVATSNSGGIAGDNRTAAVDPPLTIVAPPQSQVYDPYAGASVPLQ